MRLHLPASSLIGIEDGKTSECLKVVADTLLTLLMLWCEGMSVLWFVKYAALVAELNLMFVLILVVVGLFMFIFSRFWCGVVSGSCCALCF